MSVKASGWVWDKNLRPNHKLVLLAYADHADHEGGSIYPGVNLIASKTGYTERAIRTLTHELEEQGLLIKVGETGNGKWIYRLPMDGEESVSGVKSFQGGPLKGLTPRGEKFSGGGVKSSTALPLDEPSVEPSEETPTRAGARKGVWSKEISDGDLEELEGMAMKPKRLLVEGAYLAAHAEFFAARSGRSPRAPNIRDNRIIRREIEFALGYLGLAVTVGAVRGIFLAKHNTGGNENGELYLSISIALRPQNLERLYYIWQRQKPADQKEESTATVSTTDLLQQIAAELGAVAGFEPIAEKIRFIDGTGDVDEAEKALLHLDREMLSVADSLLSDRALFDAEMEPRIKSVAARVPPGELQRQRDRIKAHLLRETFKLPTLSLFYDPDLTRRAAEARA